MDKVRLALVGFGKWGRNYIKAAHDAGNAEVTCIVDHHGYPQELPAGVLWNSDDVGSFATECDAVVFAGHPRQAIEIVGQAAVLGLPILCEKPAGLTLVDAQYITDYSRHQVCLIGHQHLFSSAFDFARAVAKRDPVTGVFASYCGHGPVRDYNALWDYGPHAVSVALGLMGDPLNIAADSPFAGEYRLQLGYGAARVALLSASNVRKNKARCFVFTTEGGHTVEYVDTTGQLYLDKREIIVSPEPPLTRQVRAFAEAVRAGGTDDWRFGGQWATRVARILDQAERTTNPPV